jgi:hypothetical protein
MTLASRLDARKEVSGRSCIAKCMPTARRAAGVEITALWISGISGLQRCTRWFGNGPIA